MKRFRAALISAAFVGFTLPLMPVQLVLLAMNSPHKKTFPNWYHRKICRLIGLRVYQKGQVVNDRPVLLVSNHVSWMDITVLSTVAPLSFVAKKEVAGWPFFGWLAKLQRTVFVDRTRRAATGDATGAIASRLKEGDKIVLFAEGTSSDGNQVLPFKSALFAAAEPDKITMASNEQLKNEPHIQTIAIAYKNHYGLPLGHRGRPKIAWYGDKDLLTHMWEMFKSGPLDVHVHISDPVTMDSVGDRKQLAVYAESQVRRDLGRLLSTGSGHSENVEKP